MTNITILESRVQIDVRITIQAVCQSHQAYTEQKVLNQLKIF